MGRKNSSGPLFETPFVEDEAWDTITSTDFIVSPDGTLGSILRTSHVLYPDSTVRGMNSPCRSNKAQPVDAKVGYKSTLAAGPENSADFEDTIPIDPAYLEHLKETSPGQEKKKKREKYTPIPGWLPEREVFLLEMLRLEGRGDYTNACCVSCGGSSAHYRCSQCFGMEMHCQRCIVLSHACNALHMIEKWTEEGFFERVSLKDLGLVIQLGHPHNQPCKNPKRAHQKGFIVLDTYGIHKVELFFCKCTTSQEEYVQVLRYGWYPASADTPKTAATMNVLKFFQLLNFESKVSLYEFYHTLARWSDNTGVKLPKDRYLALVVMVREFRNLKSLKRGARGHSESGVRGTQNGELAVLCPACPQPGINMSLGWQFCAAALAFLHCLFLAIDANFRLKRRDISSDDKDPSLADGWSYFVPQAEYNDHIRKYDAVIVQPKSTCSDHKAVSAERATKGLAATGVSTVDCARHDMKRPLGVGDLHKGERFVNTDFMFFKSLQNSNYQQTVVSYDICCQWSIGLWNRMKHYPPPLQIEENKQADFRFLVPKFHLPSHVMACQNKFSFNFAPRVGRTDGEAPERGWAKINPVAPSSAEMGPGNRKDTLNDHFGDFNWKKTTTMATSLKIKLIEAVREANDYRFLHNQFVVGLDQGGMDKWKKELSEWESDNSKPNPFEKRLSVITQESVRTRLAAEDAKQVKDGDAYAHYGDTSGAQLITMGLDYEEQQRQILTQRSRKDSSPLQATALQNRTNVLDRKIQRWIEVQYLHIPDLYRLRQDGAGKQPSDEMESDVTSVKLYLPSSILGIRMKQTTSRTKKPVKVKCDGRLIKIEYELRFAQANDALHELRNGLRLRSYVYIDKDLFQRGQRRNTRSRGIISRLQERVSAAVARYRAAREAISHLASELNQEGWERDFPKLTTEDVRGFNVDDLPRHMKEKLTTKQKKSLLAKTSKKAKNQDGSKDVSWIWRRVGAHAADDDAILQEDLRIEFCKSKARADRWKEEVLLLQEEMNRVKRFFEYRQKTWLTLAKDVRVPTSSYDVADASALEGLRAYALQQAMMFDTMKKHCESVWVEIPQYSMDGEGNVFFSDTWHKASGKKRLGGAGDSASQQPDGPENGRK